MIIYRIEHDTDRRGPFWNGFVTDDHPARSMPSPFDAGQSRIKTFFFARINQLQKEDETSNAIIPEKRRVVFGFLLASDLDKWWDHADRRNLSRAGYVLASYEVSPRDLAISATQVVFDRSRADRLGCDSLTQ